MWEPVPPAPRVPDPQAPARVRDDSAGDFRATHTHTHAHSRTHARALGSLGPSGRRAPAVGGRGGDVGSPLGLSLDLRLLPQRHCSICTPFFRESARIFMERLARGRPAPRPPRLLQRPGDGLRGAPGSPTHGTSQSRATPTPGWGSARGGPPGGPGLGHASAGSARHFGTFGRAAPLRAGARAPWRGGRHRGSRLLRVPQPGSPLPRGPPGWWLGAWRAAWESGGRERPQEGLDSGGRQASEASRGTEGRGTGKPA